MKLPLFSQVFTQSQGLRHSAEVQFVWFPKLWTMLVCLVFLLAENKVVAQTDFAPGEIMFTGYDSDGIDRFSFVLLKDVVSGTVIAITDWGWSNTTGFRIDNTFEGAIELTFNADYPCGTQIFFNDSNDANDWDNPVNQNNVVVGTVVILGTGSADGPDLSATGDQLFIFQNPIPTSGNQANFVTAIQMNGNWQASATTDDESAKPTGLADNQVVRFNTEVDNVKYDCSPNIGTPVFLQTAITNDNGAGTGTLVLDIANNWAENDITPFTLTPGCGFCCGAAPAPPVINAPSVVSTNQTFTITITGVLTPGFVWQLYTAGCGSGSPLQTTTGSSFTVTAPGTPSTVTYYVKTSETLSCPTPCASISVCVVANLYATCTNCSANPAICGDCFLPSTGDNPDLDSGCYELKLIFILDESGSIGGDAPNVQAGVLAFLDALNGQNIQAALIEFNDVARLVNNYTLINQTYINNVGAYFAGNSGPLGQTYSPSGGTNWHDAMVEADALASADLIIFMTDGVPTAWNDPVNYCGNGATTQTPEIVNPVKISNKLKNEGTHMFMLGVGGNITAPNLQLMSGPILYQSGTNTIGNADYSIGDFEDLAIDLQTFVVELCNTEIEIIKTVTGPACDGVIEFMFIIKNVGTLSSTTTVFVTDTFPSGYTNIMYSGPFIKLCPYLQPCDPPQPTNAFVWQVPSIPPLGSDTLILTATVLPMGPYQNIAWAQTENADTVNDTFPGDNISDDLDPTIMCPPNISISCSVSSLPPGTGTPTVNDPDGTDPEVTFQDVITGGSCPNEFTITRTWTVTDGCNNTATCVQTIFVDDITAPQLTCPANVTIECNASTLPANTGSATATDCDVNPEITYTETTMAGACPAEYKISRTWKAEDDCGNITTCIQMITIDDSMAPMVSCPPNITITCTANTLPASTGTATATDNCDTSPDITFTDVVIISPVCSQERTINRTWKSTDECGNMSTCLQVITVEDNTPPGIICPVNVTIECSASTLPPSTGTATATDNCDTSPQVTYSDVVIISPVCPQEKLITRTWIATDDCGNSNSCVQQIIVDDSVVPSIMCPPNIVIECSASTLPATTGAAVSTDNCDTTPTITYTDITVASPTCAQEKTINRTWKATDDCGNMSTCLQVITVDDSTPPSLTCPANVTIECTANTLPANTGTAASSDNCDATPTITYTDATLSVPTCSQEYKINRTWQSTDDCGNISTCLQVITVDDSTPPVIICPANVTIECTSNTLPETTGNATATDNCDSSPVITFADMASPTCVQELIIYRTWTAEDECGNTSTCLQVVMVDDSTPPTISCPADLTIECTSNTLPVNTGIATATDNCGTLILIAHSDVTLASGTCAQEYTITRTWSATDVCGNSSTCVQLITIVDSQAPDMTCPADVTIECTENTLPPNTGQTTATDLCETDPEVTFNDVTLASSTCAQEYVITRTWTVSDACGNSNTCVQLITVDDSLAPDIICPTNVTIECSDSTLPENTGNAGATDNCDPEPLISFSDSSSDPLSCPQEFIILRTWMFTDACGNSTNCIQEISIVDNTPPQIACPIDVTIECLDDTLPSNTGEAVATDNCDLSPLVTFTDITLNGPQENGYTIQRTWIATDACENSATCLQIITLSNPIDPDISGFEVDTICSGQTIMFTALDQGLGTTSYSWSFGSGSSPASANGIGPHSVTYTYNGTNGTGGADVLLTVTIEGCASVTDTVANIHVNAVPNPAIMMTPSGNLCYYRLRTFKPVAPEVPGYSYEWTFGPGASMSNISGYGPHQVEWDSFGLGTQIVQLIVFSNEAGASCGDTGTITFQVIECLGSISGRVRRPDNVGIASVTIKLYLDNDWNGLPDGASIKTVFTNSTGQYTITGYPPGQYVVQETNLVNYTTLYDIDETTVNDIDSVANTDPTDDLIPVTLEASEIDGGNIFVDVLNPGIINGYVFEDFDDDGMPDTGNGEGIAGVTVELFADTDQNGIPDGTTPLFSTTTSSIGFYAFGNITNGDYVLKELQPPLYENIQDIDLTNDNDIVANSNMTDDMIPVTIVVPETDAQNFFIEATLCPSVVTSIDDDGPGTLRRAINCCCSGSNDTIQFAGNLANQVIHLTSGRIEISKTLHILSSLSPRVMIHSDVAGAFKINSGFTVEFKNINFTSGHDWPLGATFENYGNLVLWDCQLFKNIFLDPDNYMIYNGPPGILTAKGTLLIEFD